MCDLSEKFGGHCESVVNPAGRVLALDGNRPLALGGGRPSQNDILNGRWSNDCCLSCSGSAFKALLIVKLMTSRAEWKRVTAEIAKEARCSLGDEMLMTCLTKIAALLLRCVFRWVISSSSVA
jgi:hypothetical protein